jgi:hypothetical protein
MEKWVRDGNLSEGGMAIWNAMGGRLETFPRFTAPVKAAGRPTL